MKSLVTTLRKMGAEKARLIKENKLLKEDLQRSMEEKEGKLNPSDSRMIFVTFIQVLLYTDFLKSLAVNIFL